ncbi:hypothetical protein BCR34DRAFT_484150 [Clohesyomyces aquaticus]|uniref:F-box domain-containing protein n=1 Tax=Clohesyomyces aquaticus TaxID=1231657 RepID=A0A1Y1ZMH2_9PLEO|nr:hypothetical protein BCR34DRAFT_484150 [Clohesyomyces aquaticus]
MAATSALANRHIVSTILHQLSDMKYKVRRQFGPDQPVEFLEFRPTLVPAILVNRLWADEGTSILWKRYPHLPALSDMDQARRQYYANKVQQIFSTSPPPGHPATLEYQDDLRWPNLESLELEVDFFRHGAHFLPMLHPGLEHLELSRAQGGGSEHFAEVVLSSVFAHCTNLQSIKFGPGVISNEDPMHVSVLYDYLDSVPSLKSVELKGTNFIDQDALFTRLTQRTGLKSLEISLDPGLSLLPKLQGPSAFSSPFSSLKRLIIMCYPEVALALPVHLTCIEELQLDICRIPDTPAQENDPRIFEDLIATISSCTQLRMVKIAVGAMTVNFPSHLSFPTLSGASLVGLASSCPNLEDVNLLAMEPSAVDGAAITSKHFDMFCWNLPRLRNLSLKLRPTTSMALETTALQSLGRHCRDLELVRLKLPFRLPSLPVPSHIPEISIDGGSAGNTPTGGEHLESPFNVTKSTKEQQCESATTEHMAQSNASVDTTAPLFPHLTHLAISRPDNILATVSESFDTSSASCGAAPSEDLDPDLEADLVRSWAHPLLAHFPKIEILEAWGDYSGQDNESLNYFLPTEEILASTWEFLSGAEQDLWDEDEEGVESWETYDESGEDWDTASYVDSLISSEGVVAKMLNMEEEEEGQITPGRTMDGLGYFQTESVRSEKPATDEVHIRG